MRKATPPPTPLTSTGSARRLKEMGVVTPNPFAVNFLMESIEKFLLQERLKSSEEVSSEQLSVMAEAV